jgi:hypothetical protein
VNTGIPSVREKRRLKAIFGSANNSARVRTGAPKQQPNGPTLAISTFVNWIAPPASRCQWPLWGDERPTFRYCGRPRCTHSRSYCADHEGIAHAQD